MNCFRSALLSFHSPTPLLEPPKRALMKAATIALSFNLLLSSPIPPLLAAPLLPSSVNTPMMCSDQHRNSQEANSIEDAEETPSASVDPEQIVQEAWQIINDSYLDTGKRRWSVESWQQKKSDLQSTKIQNASKAHELIKRMLGGLGDPYTRFLSRSEFSKMARYDMTGIGINLREVPGVNGEVKLMILGLLLDGPAHSAGVHQGDEVLSVNGEDVRGKSAFEVSTMLQGPNETSVTIEVKRGDCEGTQSFEVERQVVARTPVFYKLEQVGKNGPSVGYIRLKEFNALARKDLVIAIKRLQEMGASYFILDLRDNLGGLVQVGIETAKLFLNKGETVIYTAGRDSQYQNTIVSDASQLVSSPVVVLVNNRTASASEIVASALHDNCRAVLVGEKTFGKGLIQSVFELRDGSGVVVTVGKYVTTNHIDINGNGLDPDFKNLPEWSKVEERLSYCSKKM